MREIWKYTVEGWLKMSAITLLIIIVLFIALLIAIIHIYDRYLVREIKLYEKRLEEKGILKRHFIKRK